MSRLRRSRSKRKKKLRVSSVLTKWTAGGTVNGSKDKKGLAPSITIYVKCFASSGELGWNLPTFRDPRPNFQVFFYSLLCLLFERQIVYGRKPHGQNYF